MIKVVRIISGEELIGEVQETSTGLTLTNVGVVTLVQTPTGVGISLYPFAPYAETSEFTFKQDHIVTTFEPSLDLRNNYSKMFGSGIQLVSPGSVKL